MQGWGQEGSRACHRGPPWWGARSGQGSLTQVLGLEVAREPWLMVTLWTKSFHIYENKSLVPALWTGLSLPLLSISETRANVYQKANQDFRFFHSNKLQHPPFSNHFSQLLCWQFFPFLEPVDLGKSPLPQPHLHGVLKC